MQKSLKTLAFEARRSFSSKLDFSDESPLANASLSVLHQLEKFKIGPAVLALLIVFAFPEKSRNRLWQEMKKTVQENREG